MVLRGPLALLVLALGAGWARAEPEPSFEHAAACVAAMKPNASALAARYRAGDDAVKGELLRLAEASFAFIGTAYEAGLRKDEADRLAAAAEERQKSLPSAELEKLATACRTEGAALLADANAFERVLVREAAKVRVARIRDK